MRTVAVAGTNGKSTVAWLVREVLEEAQQLTGGGKVAGSWGKAGWLPARAGGGAAFRWALVVSCSTRWRMPGATSAMP